MIESSAVSLGKEIFGTAFLIIPHKGTHPQSGAAGLPVKILKCVFDLKIITVPVKGIDL